MSRAVLMPVYNEESTLVPVLDAVRGWFDGPVLVVDDGSTDATSRILEGRDDIETLTHIVNLGYGRSLADGFAEARSRGVTELITMDVDGQHEPRHIPQFFEALERGDVDIVSGSRYLPGSASTGEAPGQRREINSRITGTINDLTGWGLTDAFCGFKAYRLGALRGMPIREPGYAMPMELWARAYKLGLRVRELAVERIYFDHDRSFGEDLDDPVKRYDYYMRVWNDTLAEEA